MVYFTAVWHFKWFCCHWTLTSTVSVNSFVPNLSLFKFTQPISLSSTLQSSYHPRPCLPTKSCTTFSDFRPVLQILLISHFWISLRCLKIIFLTNIFLPSGIFLWGSPLSVFMRNSRVQLNSTNMHFNIILPSTFCSDKFFSQYSLCLMNSL